MRPVLLAAVALAACDSTPPDLSTLNDVVPPRILDVSPPDGADGVGVAVSVRVSFSEMLDAATVTDQTFRLEGPDGVVGAELSLADSVAVLRPVASLTGGVTYQATVSPAITDLAGNRLAQGRTWSFTTRIGFLP